MQQGSVLGFVNAPVSLGMIVLTTLASLISSAWNVKKRAFFGLNIVPFLTNKMQFYRLFTSQVIFGSPTEMIFGLILLYQFRMFERLFGSRKFASAALFYMIVSMSLQFGVLVLVPGLKFTSPGPYALIFGLFAHYKLDIPSASRYRFFGIPFTDKIFTYIVGLQVLFADYPSSLVTGICGVIAGLLYRMELVQRFFKIPTLLSSFFATTLGPILAYLGNDANRQQGYAPVSTNVSDGNDTELINQPNSEIVNQLMMMGFSEGDVRRALQLAGNNPDMATNILLDRR